MANENIMVSMSTERYEELLTTQTRFKLLVQTIVKSADLSWNKRDLTFDDNLIGSLLDVFFPGMLEERLVELQNAAIEAAKAAEAAQKTKEEE